MVSDRIQKKVVLHASRSRVWRALTDSQQFGSWFGVKLDGAFAPGTTVHGVISGTTVDDEVAKTQEKYAGTPVTFIIERMEPERLFSYHWHPHSSGKEAAAAEARTTLVEFELEEVADGILLTVTESGFDKLPAESRTATYEANDGGWSIQVILIGKYLARAS
jgi:uncharacterized protein YndB with AHSA1/START domain